VSDTDTPDDHDVIVWDADAQEWYYTDVLNVLTGLPHYFYTQDQPEWATNSTEWTTRLSLTASGVESGKYRIAWYYEYRISRTTQILFTRVTLDDNYENLVHSIASAMIHTDNYFSSAGYYHEVLASGTHHVDLDARLESALGGTVGYIRSARLEFWRVE
jgi:hypothetical protein